MYICLVIYTCNLYACTHVHAYRLRVYTYTLVAYIVTILSISGALATDAISGALATDAIYRR